MKLTVIHVIKITAIVFAISVIIVPEIIYFTAPELQTSLMPTQDTINKATCNAMVITFFVTAAAALILYAIMKHQLKEA